eukprot:1064502-Pelagomonas_calceolata.AAC.1
MQNHISDIECQVLDMNQKYDVILGQNWFLKTGPVLDYTMRAISAKRHGYRYTIKSAKSEPEPASMQPA